MKRTLIDPKTIASQMKEQFGIKTYCGIVDAHGLESFMECEGMGHAPFTLTMRAQVNRQRHAMVYWVELPDDKADEMHDAIKQAQADDNWHAPLLLLKDPDFCDTVAFEDSMKNSWSMIPNDRLDPYWGTDSIHNLRGEEDE